MEKQNFPKSLGTLSRSIVNRNVNREDLDSLPIPNQTKDECFINSAADRSDKPIPQRKSIEFCNKDCCYFSFKSCMCGRIPNWSETAISNYDIYNFYKQYPDFGFSSSSSTNENAEWLQLPDRKNLIKRYKHYRNAINEEMLEACLNTCRFDESTGLGKVHEWIRRYLYYQYTHGWYHVKISVRFFQNFLNEMKQSTFVLLPYGCVTDNGCSSDESNNLDSHQRRMIIVVKDDVPVLQYFNYLDWGFKIRIRDVSHLINTIALVSRPKAYNVREKHYVIFNPMIWHANWWMYLLVPSKYLDHFTEFNISKTNDPETHGSYGKRKRNASSELDFENCVVRFEPLHQCIGEQIIIKDIIENDSAFVYWFGGKKLKVVKLKNVPKHIQCSKRKFLEWCVEREMNTLLNLNGNSWVNVSNKQTKLFTPRKWYDEWF